MHVVVIFCLFLASFSRIYAASIRNDKDVRIATISKFASKWFLNNLKKKYTDSPVEPSRLTEYRSQEDNFKVAGIHDTLMRNIFTFLDKEDLDKVKNLSTNFRSLAALALADKLRNLNPYCVFPFNVLNELFYTFLKESGFDFASSSITEKDLEKFNSEFLLIQRQGYDKLKSGIIMFLNELIYGIDQHKPIYYNDWCFNFVRTLSQDSCPAAFQMYNIYLNRMTNSSYGRISAETFDLVDILHSNSSQDALNLIIDPQKSIISDLVSRRIAPEVIFAILELASFPLQDDAERIYVIRMIFKTGSFSPKFWAYIRNYPDLIRPYFQNLFKNFRVHPRWYKELVMEFTPREGNEALFYLLTRNAVNPFEINVFKGFNLSSSELEATLNKFTQCSAPSLTNMDILYEITSHGLVSKESWKGRRSV